MLDSWSGTSRFTMFDSEKLEFWQKAIVVADVIYGHTRNFPADERFGLPNQMRRSVSVFQYFPGHSDERQ